MFLCLWVFSFAMFNKISEMNAYSKILMFLQVLGKLVNLISTDSKAWFLPRILLIIFLSYSETVHILHFGNDTMVMKLKGEATQ